MKQDCKLEYQTNFKVFKELKGSGTCFATVRDNGEVVLLDDYCKTKTSNTDYQDNCTPGEAHGKIKTKPITYTFADEPSKPPIGDSTFEGD